MKTVCLDARMLGPCGIGTYIGNLLPFFKGTPFHFRVLVKPEDQKRLESWGWLQAIPLRASIYSIAEQLKLAAQIPFCDLFWSPHYNVPLLPIRAAKRLVTIHDAYHMVSYDTLNVFQKGYVKCMMRTAMHKSDQVITDSHFSKAELLHFFPVKEEKLQVIPLGINGHLFQTQGTSDTQLLAAYELPKRFLLFVSHLRPHKNFQGLLCAFDRVCQKEKDLSLVVIGKKDQSKRGDRIEQQLAQYPHLSSKIKLIGQVSEEHLAAFYRQATAFVFPSLYEGFGLPPLEAMRSGCPVIASKAASIPEICGDAAVYVDPHSPSDIAEGIMRVLKDQNLREQLKIKGAEQSRSFSWEKCAALHLETIERLLQ